jgi:hypothetical protein
MPVLAGKPVRARDLARLRPSLSKAENDRTSGSPAFRRTGSNRLTKLEQDVADVVTKAFDAITLADARQFAARALPTEWQARFEQRMEALPILLQRQAVQSGSRGYESGAAALIRSPDPSVQLRATAVMKVVEVIAVEPGLTGRAASRRLAFDSVHPAYTAYAQARTVELVGYFQAEAITAIGDAVGTAYSQGITWRGTAQTIEEILGLGKAGEFATREAYMARGLTPDWAQAVDRRMKQTMEAAGKAGLSPTKAYDRAVTAGDRYADKLRKARGRMIARTEIMRAANQGRKIGMNQLADDGLFNRATAGKRWLASAIDVCSICLDTDGTVVGWNAEFPTAGVDEPPAHPNCRCEWLLEPNYYGKAV